MTKQKILIADDEAQIREILKIYFEKEGFEVIEAEDGAAAILKVQSEKPDILLLDIMMPVSADSAENIHRAARHHNADKREQKRLPRRAVYGFAQNDERHRCARNNAQKHTERGM